MLSFLLAILLTPMVGILTSKFCLNTNRFGKFLFDFLASLLLVSVTQMWLLNFGTSFGFTKLITLYALLAMALLWAFVPRLQKLLACSFSNILSFQNFLYFMFFVTLATILTFLRIYENDFLELGVAEFKNIPFLELIILRKSWMRLASVACIITELGSFLRL